ncbi:9302_t:CDS:2 [Ambispora gerdemannii]|uniref:9302_t:CDS:1 n=1 Tax=Ambispora gerdemannii TaxID=144530 RepID=A0A9N9GXR1_9GLOM|nr:9302_t:CDS:2 [Ambispora gerdemannii]
MPQNYTGTIFKLWKEIDALFNEKKRVKKWSMTRLYPKQSVMSPLGIFIKKMTKNLKEETLDTLKLWVSKQNEVIDTELKSEEEEEINHDS